MTVESTKHLPLVGTAWQREVLAGLMAAVVTLPVCLAAGVLVFAPMGQGWAATGAAAGMVAAIVGGGLAALLATSSFMITSPRVNPALIQASLIAGLLSIPQFAGDLGLIVAALAVCVVLAGLWQILFGVFGVAAIIKFTPHPVLAGFLNGVGLLVVVSQLKPFFASGAGQASRIPWPERPSLLLFVAALVAFILLFQSRGGKIIGAVAGKVPGPLAGLVAGVVVFYAARLIAPGLDLGATIGSIQIGFASPFGVLFEPDALNQLVVAAPDIVIVSLVLAILASFESLFAYRTAQNLADIDIHPVRELVAQGVANCGSAAAGGICGAVSPPQFIAAYRAGGRTRWTGVSAALAILVVGTMFAPAVSAIPNAILSAILIAAGIGLLDRWSFGLAAEAWRHESAAIRRRALYDLLVVLAVMSTTLMSSVVVGVLVGCVLAGVIFIVNMSRPVVRSTLFGHEIASKRVRPTGDVAILRETGPRRVVLQLEGVLFFGNADRLVHQVKHLFSRANTVVLDFKRVSDIDVSGATVLRNLMQRSREGGKHLVFCNVPAAQTSVIQSISAHTAPVEPPALLDLDTTLEHVEERALAEHAHRRAGADLLSLHEIDFLHGLSADELANLEKAMTLREFAAGEILCHEGDDGDRMWLLLKGSVSVRLNVNDQRRSLRIASLARGTTVGEMSLIEAARRSATIVADEPVVCYELERSHFDAMRSNQPEIAAKLLANLARELARRLRRTSEDLRPDR